VPNIKLKHSAMAIREDKKMECLQKLPRSCIYNKTRVSILVGLTAKAAKTI
jgi:hypothetical protein